MLSRLAQPAQRARGPPPFSRNSIVPDSSSRLARATALLHQLSGGAGIHASASDTANYRAVFTRDAVMAGVAGLITGDATIIGAFVRTLEHLRDLQGSEGQIASNYEVHDATVPTTSFGSIAPRLDGLSWYLVGVALAARRGALDGADFTSSVRRVVRLLNAIEYNGADLLYLPTGGNWADEYPYDGYILADQVLRSWGLRLCGDVFDEPSWVVKSQRIAARIDERYWPDAADGTPRHYPLATITPTGSRDVFDLAACALLAVSGVAPARAREVLAWIATEFLARGDLPPAFHPVIHEGDADWPALRRYHRYAFRNRPHEYHNGGVWPIWLGWLALGYARSGQAAELAILRRVSDAKLGALPAYALEEYLHGRTYEAGGTARMAYSATGLIFLHAAGSPAANALLAS